MNYFLEGFLKRAAEESAREDVKLLKWNSQGGVDPRSPEDLSAAESIDLITLPQNVEGTNCSNCAFVRILDPKQGTGFCTNPQIKQDVTARMCCSLWDAPGTYRSWTQGDMADVPPADMMQAADQGLGQQMDMQQQQGFDPVTGQPTIPPEGMEQQSPDGEQAPPADPDQQQANPTPKKKDPKSEGSSNKHTINIHVGGKKQ